MWSSETTISIDAVGDKLSGTKRRTRANRERTPALQFSFLYLYFSPSRRSLVVLEADRSIFQGCVRMPIVFLCSAHSRSTWMRRATSSHYTPKCEVVEPGNVDCRGNWRPGVRASIMRILKTWRTEVWSCWVLRIARKIVEEIDNEEDSAWIMRNPISLPTCGKSKWLCWRWLLEVWTIQLPHVQVWFILSGALLTTRSLDYPNHLQYRYD